MENTVHSLHLEMNSKLGKKLAHFYQKFFTIEENISTGTGLSTNIIIKNAVIFDINNSSSSNWYQYTC